MKILALIIFLLIPTLEAKENEDIRLAIHLLDYMAGDYGGAVENGQVKSPAEYDEQIEFSSKVMTIIGDLHHDTILEKGQKLKKFIANKQEATEVAFLARSIQRDLISISKINLSPEVWPSLKQGAALYKANCQNCHGVQGFGDGEEGKNLSPLPANFHRPDRVNMISAFHCYNTIRLGVPGTGMMAFDKLDDKQIWDLAFYVMSLPFASKSSITLNTEQLTLAEMSILSNDEIKEKLSLKDDSLIIAMRTTDHQNSFDDYLSIAHKFLNESLVHYLQGDKKNAKKYAIQSYLQGIEPIEPAIRANKPELIISIETSMGEIRKLVEIDHRANELKNEIEKAQSLFQDIKQTLTETKLSFSVAMLGAFAIVLREGLEAVLLLVTLLSVVGAMNNKKAINYIHYGWTSALLTGFLMWFLSGELINVSGIGREMMEAFTALLAVIILLYFGFWLHQKTEITRWKIFIDEKINSAVANKSLFTLFSISFMTVFREAFETVLFIRSLWFQTAEQSKHAIPLGLLLSFFVIALASYFMLRYSKKLQIRKLFQISSMLMSILALVLAGKAIHSFQEIGFLPIHSTHASVRFEILGIYPVWEGVLAQGLLGLLIYFLLNKKRPKTI